MRGATEPKSHPASFGLQQRWVSWAVGSNTNPFLSPDLCGQQKGRYFFLTAAIEPGVERDCVIPAGVPLLASPGGDAAWAPTWGSTNHELQTNLAADFAQYGNPHVTLDGDHLSLDGTLTGGPVYRVRVRAHSLIRTVDPGFPADWATTKVASVGWFVVIHPLSPGHHELTLYDEFNGDPLDITFHITAS